MQNGTPWPAGDADFARINLPIDQAGGLPSIAYTDPAWLALEQDRLFAASWSFAGCVHDLAQPGDVLPVVVAGSPVVLIHGEDGVIRAFHNVCRHRGTVLVDRPERGRHLITCPYHAWAYGLDGRLRSRPHFFGGEKHGRADGADAPGLVPVRSEIWLDWIFVNLSGKAPELAEHLGPVHARIAGYNLSGMRHCGTLAFDIKTNWKFGFENYIEPYHVFATHKRLNDVANMADRRAPEFERHVLWCSYRIKPTNQDLSVGLPYFPMKDPAIGRRGLWFVVMPNFAFEIFPDHVVTFICTPLAPDRTHERLDIYVAGDAAMDERHADGRQALLDAWREINGEDVGIIERMQQGRLSRGFDGGRFSPYWDEAVRHIARLVTEAMTAPTAWAPWTPRPG